MSQRLHLFNIELAMFHSKENLASRKRLTNFNFSLLVDLSIDRSIDQFVFVSVGTTAFKQKSGVNRQCNHCKIIQEMLPVSHPTPANKNTVHIGIFSI